MPILNMGAAALPKELKMKTSSRFQCVALFVFTALFAAVSARAETYTWVGGNGLWEDVAMWNSSQGEGGTVPGSGDHAVLPAPANMADNYVVTANEAINVASLTVGSDTAGTDCLATFESKTNGIHQIGAGGLVVKAGGKLTHTALPTSANTLAAERYKLNFDVGGNVTVAADGTIDVSGRGYARDKGPGCKDGAAHGGHYADGAATYGSLVAPTNCGSGNTTAGGGAVRIHATGKLVVQGSIVSSGLSGNASYGSGAGGSVWLTGTQLDGSGKIIANGGYPWYGTGGSGGRISICLSAEAGFANWTGKNLARGGEAGSNWGKGAGAPGTVYLQSGSGGVTNSTTIIDNDGVVMSKAGYAELNAATESDVVGTLIVRNSGRVHVAAGDELKVYGSIDTRGGVMSVAGATVRLMGLAPATLQGKQPYGNFTCTEPGKTILFGTTADDNFEISSGHTLTLKGNKETTIDLRPVDETLPWKMKVNPDVETEIFYASVSNSNAKAGEYVTGYGSEDLGGNEKWNFTEVIEPGAIITWTGATDGDWTNPANWEPRRAVVKTDVAVVPSSAATMPVLDKGKVIINEIRVESGASLTLKGYDLTVTNKLTVAGALTALGKEKIFCPKDVDFTGGTFVAGGSSLVLEGNAAQQVNLNEQAFSTITIEKETGSVTFGDGFKAEFLDVHSTDALTLVFAADKTVDAARLILRGERAGGGQALVLRSSSDGRPWKLKSGTAQFIAGVDVKDSDASAGVKALTDGSSVDSHGNSNWGFGVDGIVNAQWNGTSGSFTAAENWSTGEVPGENTRVFIRAGDGETKTVTASEPIFVHDLILQGEGSGIATFESATKETHRISGDLAVNIGGKMTHTALPANANTPADECYKLNLDVGGNVTLAADATIDVTSCGYASGKGPGYYKPGTYGLAAHGGTYYVGHSYGSLSSPTNCGTGSATAGGGAVRIVSAGAIRLDGDIISIAAKNNNYVSGAGGSVWLTCSKLSGTGLINVNGGETAHGASGCGGRISICQTSAADFSEWKGKLTSKGGSGGSYDHGFGAAGSVYLQPSGGPLKSTTIVDNGGLSAGSPADGRVVELCAANESDVLGSLVVTNSGKVRIAAGETAKVYGNINTTGGNPIWTSGTLQLAGLDPATISGGNQFGDFVCTEPGKTILFGTAANDNFEMLSGHKLTLRGDEETTLDLRSANDPLQWKMKVNLDVATEIFYVSVSNSNAKAGEFVTAYGSEDLGGNVNWVFTDVIEPGAIITWTGAADSDWTNPLNWNLGRKVVETDVAVIPSVIDEEPVSTMPVLDKGKVFINEIRVENGATLTLKGYDLTVTNKLTVAGTLTALGKEKIFCPKDVDFTGGTFVAGGSSLVFSGSGAQQVNLGGQTFSTITIEKDTGGIAFADGFKAAFLDAHGTDAMTLVFAAGKTVDATRLVLRGERKGGVPTLLLRSSEDGTPWKLNSGTAQFITGVDVKDSDASAGAWALTDFTSIDSHNNTHWDFGAGGVTNAQWIGTSGSFATAANWSTGEVPDENTRVFIRAGDGEERTVTASAAISVHDMILQGEGTGLATFESATKETHRISGDLAVNFGGKMTHTALPDSANTPANECYKLNLDVGGNVMVAADATIDVTSRGYANGKGPGYLKDKGASHGGRHSYGAPTYGSLSAPTNCGSGYATAGGGVVRIVANGTITVDGSIISSAKFGSQYGSGAGGSVWLTCSDLLGGGIISVQGGDDQYCSAGSGGRLAVWLTKAADFGNWGGDLIAKGGAFRGADYGFGTAAPGTIYKQVAKGGLQAATVIIDNCNMGQYKDVGYAEIRAAAGWKDVGKVVVQNNALVKLVQDLRIGDLDMATKNAKINVGTNVLTIRYPAHKDGKGWADELDKLVVKEADPDTGKTGDVVWKPQGFLLIVR